MSGIATVKAEEGKDFGAFNPNLAEVG